MKCFSPSDMLVTRTIQHKMANGFKNFEYHFNSKASSAKGARKCAAVRSALYRSTLDQQKRVFLGAISTARRRRVTTEHTPKNVQKLESFTVGVRCLIPSARRLILVTVVAVRSTRSGTWALVQRNREHTRHVVGAIGRRPHFMAVQEAFVEKQK